MSTNFASRFLGPDDHASRPSAGSVPESTFYACTDHGIERVVGGSWADYQLVSAGGGGLEYATISGGTETTSGGYDYHAFTTSGTLTVSAPGMVEALVVGGGGGGGGEFSGGGGGGGGVRFAIIYVDANVTVTVGVGGGGGAAANGVAARGGYGGASRFAGITAIGGGGGDAENDGDVIGDKGANGGGGGTRDAQPGGPSVALGFSGGTSRTGTTSNTGAGGGGGGASANGADGGPSSDVAGDGGAGATVTEFSGFGASGVFGGGGGGGAVELARAVRAVRAVVGMAVARRPTPARPPPQPTRAAVVVVVGTRAPRERPAALAPRASSWCASRPREDLHLHRRYDWLHASGPEPDPITVTWAWSGNVSTTAATIKARCADSATVTLRYSTDPGLGGLLDCLWH